MTALFARATFTMISHADEPRVPVVLSWDPADPLAVRVHFPELDTEWEFALDLLTEGIESKHAVGEGDVRVGPDNDPWLVQIRVMVDEKVAVFAADRTEINGFVDVVVSAIAVGQYTDPGKALDAFLGEVFAA